MLTASFKKHTLIFKNPAGTSRGVLHTKDSWYIILKDSSSSSNVVGIGECSIIPNLSIDDRPDYEDMLSRLCADIENHREYEEELRKEWPSVMFGLETALADLASGGRKIFYPSSFTSGDAGIPINGLVWMGDKEFMLKQIREKTEVFDCVKMKIGAIDFDTELDILKGIREKYPNKPELRVDANGAFAPEEAMEKLELLAKCNLHSIEQPIRQGNVDAMAELCRKSPLPIALDEELIGLNTVAEKQELLSAIRPQYIILKPSLLGGIKSCEEWISLAEQMGIGWWITSALEGNIGLNHIAQWAYSLGVDMPQGLGTGSLYTNNIPSPLEVRNGKLWYQNNHRGTINE